MISLRSGLCILASTGVSLQKVVPLGIHTNVNTYAAVSYWSCFVFFCRRFWRFFTICFLRGGAGEDPSQESSPPTRRRGEALRRCAPVEELPSQVCVAEAADLIVRARTDLSPRATRDLAAAGRNRVLNAYI